jgi:ubiquinone/menaquinone biosynthesis C-methylase UbiE
MSEDYKTRKDTHDYFEPPHVAQFMRNHNTGINNLGRYVLASIVNHHHVNGKPPRVLDVGCGTAVNYEVIKNLKVDCQYTGLDRTQKFVDHANKLYGNNENFNMQLGFAQEIPFDDNSFDVVIIRHVLEHLDDYEQAIQECLRVAAKEVVVVFFLEPSAEEEDKIEKNGPDERGCYYYWNTYSWPKFVRFISSRGVQLQKKVQATPNAAHVDTIVRLMK